MLKVYKCITTCTWNGRYWEEGTLTRPLDSKLTPPEHFVEVTSTEELKETLEDIDQEEDPATYAELQDQINDAVQTGTGIADSDELSCKSREQLIEIAKEKGVYNSSLRTRTALIEAIENIEEEEGE